MKVTESTGIRYLAIGGLSFVLDFGLLFVLHEIAGLPLWFATTTAFLASFAFNYLLQRAFSFTSDAHHGRALVKYTILVIANTIATTVIVAAFDFFGTPWEVGKVVATVVTTLWNYFLYRHWVFNPGRKGRTEGSADDPDESPDVSTSAQSEGN